MKMPPHALQMGTGVLVAFFALVFAFPQARAWGAGPLPNPSLPEQQHDEEPTPVPAPATGPQQPSAEGPLTPVEFEQRRIPRPTSPTPAAPPAAPVVLPPPVTAPPPPPPGKPFPLGGISIGPETRRTETTFPGGSRTTQESVYNLGMQQLIPALGVLNVGGSWADAATLQRHRSFFAQLQGMQVLGRTLDVTVGDTFVIPSLLQEDRPRGQAQFSFFPTLFPLVTTPFPLRRPAEQFLNFFPPSLPLEGIRLDLSSPTSHYSLLGGRVATVKGFAGNITDVTDESVLGAKASQQLWDRLLLGAGVFRTEHSASLPDGSTIREDTSLFSSVQWRLSPAFLVQGEYGVSKHDIGGPSGLGRGTDVFWIAGPQYQTETFFASLNYQRIGAAFPLFKRFSQEDRAGILLNMSAQPWLPLSLFGIFERFHNNLDHDPRRLTIDTTRGLLGGAYLLPTRTLLALRGEVTARASRASEVPGAIDTLTPGFRVDVSQPFLGSYRALLRYGRDMTSDHLGPGSTIDTIQGALTGVFSNLYILAAEDVITQFGPHREHARRSFTSSANVGYRFASSLDAFLQLSWTRDVERQARTSQDHYNLGARVRSVLPCGLTLNLDLSYGFEERGSKTVQLTAGLSKSFVYGSVPPATALPPGVAHPAVPPIGTIEGFVLTEPARQGVPNIRIILDGGPALFTDAQGRYSFAQIREGEHTIRLDLQKLPATFALLGPPERPATVQARGLSRLDFSLAPLGRILGRVMHDANRNGQLDPEEEGMANVRLVARLDQEHRVTFTALDGTFLFENLQSGTYTIEVYPSSLPRNAVRLPTPALTVLLEPYGEVKDLLCLIQLPLRPVIRRQFYVTHRLLPEAQHTGDLSYRDPLSNGQQGIEAFDHSERPAGAQTLSRRDPEGEET